MKKRHHGARAWLGLVLYIISYDIWAAKTKNETLSTAFYNSLKHPIKRWPTIVIWAYITAHLFKFIPDKIDPLRLPWKTHFISTKGKIILIVQERKVKQN